LNDNPTDDARAATVRALAVAERLIADAPIQKMDMIAVQYGGLRIMLHHRPEGVAEWACLHGLSLVLTTDYNDDQRPYIEASGRVSDVPVSVWALGAADEQERYAACVPVAERSAAGAA
jgi:hypothetical protein